MALSLAYLSVLHPTACMLEEKNRERQGKREKKRTEKNRTKLAERKGEIEEAKAQDCEALGCSL